MQRQPIKVTLLGKEHVGKSSIVKRLTENQFTSTTSTISACMQQIYINNQKILIFDTAGQERFQSMTKYYYRNSDIILLVYDITDQESLPRIKQIYEQVLQDEPNAKYLLIGNKSDLDKQREVVQADVDEFCFDNHLQQIQFSCKNDNSDVIKNILTQLINNLDNNLEYSTENIIREDTLNNQKKKGKCDC